MIPSASVIRTSSRLLGDVEDGPDQDKLQFNLISGLVDVAEIIIRNSFAAYHTTTTCKHIPSIYLRSRSIGGRYLKRSEFKEPIKKLIGLTRKVLKMVAVGHVISVNVSRALSLIADYCD